MKCMACFLSRRPTLLLTALLMLAAPIGHAQPTTSDAFEQNRKLGRGVNIIGYDPIWRSRDQARFQAKHFRLLKEAGFNSVRINLQPFRFMSATNDYALSASWFELLDWSVREAQAQDLRGLLTFAEVGEQVPFEVKRYFLVSGVATKEVRGEHAHRKLHQFLVCVQGQCHIVADDGRNRQEFVLDSPTLALYLPPMVWGIQYRFSQDAVLLVLCSEKYDSAEYIRDYSGFLPLAQAPE